MTHTVRLPEGWCTTTLGEIRVDYSKSIDPRKEPNQPFELYSIPSFADGHPEIVKGSGIGSTKKTLIPGTVVVSKINPRINRVWVVGNYTEHRKIGSGEWIPFFPVSGIQPEYLAYYLRRNDFRDYLATRVSGVGGSLMRVKPSTLADYPLVLPSPQHQQSIVEAIESYLTRLDDTVALLKRVQRNLERYRASVLKAAVEGRLVPTEAELARKKGRSYEPASELLKRILVERRKKWIENAAEKARAKAEEKARKAGKPWTHADDIKTLEKERAKATKKYKEPAAPDTTKLPDLPEGWCWTNLGQYLIGINTGKNFRCLEKPPVCGEVGVVKVSSVSWGRFQEEESKTCTDLERIDSQAFIHSGDFLLSRANTIKLVGACVLVDRIDRTLMLSDKVLRFRLAGNIDRWILWVLRSLFGRREIESLATGNQESMRNISQQSMKRIRVPLPPASELSRILGHIDIRYSKTRAVRASVDSSSRRASSLRQSILKWAFEGKLVPQDPEDEPASALLDRIKAECSASRRYR